MTRSNSTLLFLQDVLDTFVSGAAQLAECVLRRLQTIIHKGTGIHTGTPDSLTLPQKASVGAPSPYPFLIP